MLLINDYTARLDKIRKRRFPRSPVTRFGSLPTGIFDAQTIVPPGSTVPLVILNRDIFYVTGALSHAVAASVPITIAEKVQLDYSEQSIRRQLHDHPDIVQDFADAMSRLVQVGSAAGAKENSPDGNQRPIYLKLLTAMQLFIISHEESHVILKHVSHDSIQFHLAGTRSLGMSEDTVPSTTLKAELRTRQQELDADALGFRLLIWSEEEEDDSLGEMMAAAAPLMIFRLLDAASSYASQAGGWTFGDINHPSAPDRIKALSPVFDEVAKTRAPLREVDLRVPFDAVFKVLLAEADPQIRKNLGLSVIKTH